MLRPQLLTVEPFEAVAGLQHGDEAALAVTEVDAEATRVTVGGESNGPLVVKGEAAKAREGGLFGVSDGGDAA